MELLSGEVGIVESPVTVHYQGEIGRGQARANGYALADDEQEQDTIDLFVAVYRGFDEPTKVLNKELEDAAKQAVRFFLGALGDLHTRLDPAHDPFAMAQRIHEARLRIKRARLFILTDGLSDLARGKPKVMPLKDSSIDLKIEFWDLERLARALASGRPQEEIDIDVGCARRNTIGVHPAARRIQRRIFSFRHRCPGRPPLPHLRGSRATPAGAERTFLLTSQGKVNRGIRDSLKVQPGAFSPTTTASR